MPANTSTTSKSNTQRSRTPKPTLNSIYAGFGGWQNFMLSYGLKPYSDDDIQEGKSIAQGLLDHALEDWEEENKKA